MLGVERMCQLAQVSRAGYYRHLTETVPDEAEMALQATMQEIVLTHHRRYGYRRVTAELRRRGMAINHKRVLRMMRNDNLLAVRFRKFILTTDSRHEFDGDADSRLILGRLAQGGSEIHWVEGNHHTLLKEPQARGLAEKIGQRLQSELAPQTAGLFSH